VVFSGVNNIDDAQHYNADVKGRMQACGRSREHLKILPGAFVVVGETVAEARAKKARLDSLVHPDSGMASLCILLGHDVSSLDLDGPLPEIPQSNASQSGRQKLVEMAQRDNMTIRQLAQYVGGSFSTLEIIGTPRLIADTMEEWLGAEGCDGFNVVFPYLPGGLDDFVDHVVPEL